MIRLEKSRRRIDSPGKNPCCRSGRPSNRSAFDVSPCNAGFTLLEVLVALAILALSATAVIRQIGNNLNQQSVLEAKTIATVLAENQLALAEAGGSFPALGRGTQSVSFQDRQWSIHTEVSATSDPWLRKIEVSISEDNNPDYILSSLISYRGRY